MDLLNEILINIALFRVYKSSSYIVMIPKHCTIYIELSNTLGYHFEEKVIYRKYVKDREYHIEKFDIEKLEIKETGPNRDSPEVD
jgi:hypothetical protein